MIELAQYADQDVRKGGFKRICTSEGDHSHDAQGISNYICLEQKIGLMLDDLGNTDARPLMDQSPSMRARPTTFDV